MKLLCQSTPLLVDVRSVSHQISKSDCTCFNVVSTLSMRTGHNCDDALPMETEFQWRSISLLAHSLVNDVIVNDKDLMIMIVNYKVAVMFICSSSPTSSRCLSSSLFSLCCMIPHNSKFVKNQPQHEYC